MLTSKAGTRGGILTSWVAPKSNILTSKAAFKGGVLTR